MLLNDKNIYKVKRLIAKTPFNRNFITDRALRKQMEEAVPHVKGILLDVGCGEKPYEKLFTRRVDTYLGLDLPHSHSFYSVDTNVDVYGDSRHLPFRRESIDTIICTEVLPHVAEPSQTFSQFSSVLKRGGILVVTANKSWEKRTGLPVSDYWRFTDDGLCYLARENNLDVIYARPGCGFLAMLGQLIARFLNKELIYRRAVKAGLDRRPNVFLAIICLPIIALVQVFFLTLERLYFSKIDTLFYVIVARKTKPI